MILLGMSYYNSLIKEKIKMKLDVKAMALTLALVWSLGLFFLTWWVILFEGVSHNPNIISYLYRGYSFTPLGSIIGFLWAFVDGAFGGACLAWIYNGIAGKKSNK